MVVSNLVGVAALGERVMQGHFLKKSHPQDVENCAEVQADFRRCRGQLLTIDNSYGTGYRDKAQRS